MANEIIVLQETTGSSPTGQTRTFSVLGIFPAVPPITDSLGVVIVATPTPVSKPAESLLPKEVIERGYLTTQQIDDLDAGDAAWSIYGFQLNQGETTAAAIARLIADYPQRDPVPRLRKRFAQAGRTVDVT